MEVEYAAPQKFLYLLSIQSPLLLIAAESVVSSSLSTVASLSSLSNLDNNEVVVQEEEEEYIIIIFSPTQTPTTLDTTIPYDKILHHTQQHKENGTGHDTRYYSHILLLLWSCLLLLGH